jgi:hypothetical protein
VASVIVDTPGTTGGTWDRSCAGRFSVRDATTIDV